MPGENGADPEAPVQVAVQVQMVTVPLALPPSGRPAQLILPADITDFEIIALMVSVAGVGDKLRAARQQNNLVIAKTMPTPRPT